MKSFHRHCQRAEILRVPLKFFEMHVQHVRIRRPSQADGFSDERHSLRLETRPFVMQGSCFVVLIAHATDTSLAIQIPAGSVIAPTASFGRSKSPRLWDTRRRDAQNGRGW